MKLPKALTKNLIERLAILTIIVDVLAWFLILFPIFPFFDYINPVTEDFNLNTDLEKIESIELVNWFNEMEPGDYLIYRTVDPQEHPDLPQALDKMVYNKLWTEPIGPHGDCFRIVASDQTISFICQNGYAQYDNTGHQIAIGLDLSAKGKQFKTLWETYKNP